MTDFIAVANIAEIGRTGRLCLEVADRFVVIVHVDGEYYCLDDVCTHDGGTLGEGELIDHCLVCPRHGAQFDVRNGSALTMPATEPTTSHEVRIDGDRILVRLNEN